MTCDYSVWSSWSTSCGTGMTRKRTLTEENEYIIEQQGGCSGLKTSCDKEEMETKDMDCKYNSKIEEKLVRSEVLKLMNNSSS